MNKEDKELLLKDLYARLPYGVKFSAEGEDIIREVYYIRNEEVFIREYRNLPYWIETIKPYLRPLSSMTEEERVEFYKVGGLISYKVKTNTYILTAFSPKAYDLLNAHHLDYRGLIEKDLALEAPEDMYK